MTPGTRRFVVLDAWRGICAVLVCLFHFRVNGGVATWEFIHMSWQFVDFFFVLSGFVIAANYRERLIGGMSWWRFLALRLGRIYPLHLFTLAVLVAVEIAGAVATSQGAKFGRESFDSARALEAIPTNLLLLQSWGIHDGLTWNGPSWSIAAEFWGYAMFALLAVFAGTRLERWLLAVAVVCPLILLWATPYGINVAWNFGTIRCFYGFALGVLCWSVWQRHGSAMLARASGWSLVEAATVAAVVGFVIVAGPTQWNLLGPPLFAVAVLVFAREGGLVSRVLATPLPLLLGTLSYSIYMIHTLVQARMDDVLKLVGGRIGVPLTTPSINAAGTRETLVGADPVQGAVLTLVMLALVVAASWLTYRFVEVPGQRWSRARFDPKVRHRAVEPEFAGDAVDIAR